jgi:hypothetical protein
MYESREEAAPGVISAQNLRKSRSDSTAHFPFTDDQGTVPDVLKGDSFGKPNLFKIGVPGRKRLVERVFNEMRFDKPGIRLSDLPEALEVSDALPQLHSRL